jgi:HPt (histidine-containing phosphotransfer) domain-containing protein
MVNNPPVAREAHGPACLLPLPPAMSPTAVATDTARPMVLDAAALARLQELDPEGKNGLLPRVLHTYLASLERLLPQAEAALAAGDAYGLRYVAHTLKSSSSSVGALQLAAACLTLERQVSPATLQDCESLARAMLVEGQRARAVVVQMLDSPA